jgi:hypothetical protein
MSATDEITKAQARKLELENAALEAKLDLMSKQSEAMDQDMVNKRIEASAAETKAAMATKSVSLAYWSTIIKGVWTFISSILSSIGSVFKVILRDLSPYLALFIVIIVFLGGLSLLAGGGGRSQSRYRSKDAPKEPYAWLRWFSPGYKIRSLFNYFKGNVKSIKRPIEKYGRCDNVEWQHTGGSGSGLCVRSYAPKDIEWNLGSDKIQDLKRLPKELSDKLTKDGQKLKIYIPWAEQGPFYVPQCSKAYFKVLDSSGNEQKESAAYLLKDNGLTCERVTKESKKYGVMYRPIGAKNKFDFASEENPKCSA